MAARHASNHDAADTMLPAGDQSAVNRIRLLLAAAAFLAYLVDAPAPLNASALKALVLGGYLAYSTILFAAPQTLAQHWNGRHIIWFDIAWYGLLISVTDPLTSVLFLFFPFAILVASLRYGAEEGRLVSAVSAMLYAIIALNEGVPDAGQEWARLALRTAFLLALGLMVARWGGAEAAQRQRLTLLREVHLLSNPRFGIDHTVSSIMEKLKAFFQADACVLICHDPESNACSVRQTTARDGAGAAMHAQRLPPETVRLLLPFPPGRLVLFRRRIGIAWRSQSRCHVLESGGGRWIEDKPEIGESVADALNTASYISAPLRLRKGTGRVYICSAARAYTRDDALFLNHAAARALSVIENIELLDRLASEAALQERQRIVGDLHDSTIQSYIGLKMGLEALRNKAARDNPLTPDIEQLLKMTNGVIDDLRAYVSALRHGRTAADKTLLSGVLRMAARFRDFYGIDIDVHAEGELQVSDRLAAEALQMVSEGLSNIRKHTTARHGLVKLACRRGMLLLQIQNEGRGQHPAFTPRSITERAAALGGKAWVEAAPGNPTTVSIEIPV